MVAPPIDGQPRRPRADKSQHNRSRSPHQSRLDDPFAIILHTGAENDVLTYQPSFQVNDPTHSPWLCRRGWRAHRHTVHFPFYAGVWPNRAAPARVRRSGTAHAHSRRSRHPGLGRGAFVAQLHRAGWINSLAQTAIKLPLPGLPDIYQGTEEFDDSLDPDNRKICALRPVNCQLFAGARHLERWLHADAKQRLIALLLAARGRAAYRSVPVLCPT